MLVSDKKNRVKWAYPEDEPKCPECNSENTSQEYPSWAVAVEWLHFKCNSCGNIWLCANQGWHDLLVHGKIMKEKK